MKKSQQIRACIRYDEKHQNRSEVILEKMKNLNQLKTVLDNEMKTSRPIRDCIRDEKVLTN